LEMWMQSPLETDYGGYHLEGVQVQAPPIPKKKRLGALSGL
jgi:hypothetical protein